MNCSECGKCPECGTSEVMLDRHSIDSPIHQYFCINGHRFKITTCYKMDPPFGFRMDAWENEWKPVNEGG